MSFSPVLGNPKPQYEDSNGVPYNGMRLFFYEAGTSNKQDTYTDSTGGTPNTNPVVIDSAGYPTGDVMIYGEDSYIYKIVAAPPGSDDPPTSPLWTIDNVYAQPAIDATLITFDTPALAAADTSLIAGDVLFVRGYHAAGDGGHGLWTVKATGTANSISVLNMTSGDYLHLIPSGDVYEFGVNSSRSDAQNSTALTQALTDLQVVKTNGKAVNLGAITMPAGSILDASRSLITCSDYFTRSSNTTLIGGVFTFSVGGITGNGANNIIDENIKVTTDAVSTASACLYQNSTGVTQVNCTLTSPTRNGLYTQDVSEVTVKGGKYNDNNRNGIFVTGSTGVVTDIFLDPDEANDNGNASTYSGINVYKSTRVTIPKTQCLRNAEHGCALQYVSDFDVDIVGCDNGGRGINMQDDGTAGTPCSNGTFGGLFTGNDWGVYFLDTNNNITIKSGTTIINNTSGQLRLVDSGGSGRLSDKIIGKSINLNDTPNAFINSNSSTNVNITQKHNEVRAFTGEIRDFQDIASQLTIDIDPTKEIFFITGWATSADDVARTSTADIIDGMVITLFADDAAGFRIRHNAGGAGLAPFYNLSGATDTLAQYESRTYMARGSVWYQYNGV